ncbi:MAG: MFS transporter [Nitrospirae bacterium]|nr:MAG: MFS transporter [Nitrospirota bacterium]
MPSKLFWVGVLYFGEGFPFGLLMDAYPVYFRMHGMSLRHIGLLSVAGLAWTLKFCWAPVVDLVGERRTWIVTCQVLLSAGMLVLLWGDIATIGPSLWLVFLLLALCSATQDIAIDAYSIQFLEKRELGLANGVRVTAYRIALIASGGWLVAGAGMWGWAIAFAGAAVLLAGLALWLSWRLPPLPRLPAVPSLSLYERVVLPFADLLQRPKFIIVALFILTFKLGDMALGPMIRPFWVDRQFSPVQIGLIPGTVGVLATIGGALAGGFLTSRWGIYRSMWILGAAQAGSNLMYVFAAVSTPSVLLMYAASIVESFCGGLGTAPFLAFLMHLCSKRFAATQYAVLSALFGLTRVVAGSVSGLGVESLGYPGYFTLTTILALPAFTLLPFIKRWVEQEQRSW